MAADRITMSGREINDKKPANSVRALEKKTAERLLTRHGGIREEETGALELSTRLWK